MVAVQERSARETALGVVVESEVEGEREGGESEGEREGEGEGKGEGEGEGGGEGGGRGEGEVEGKHAIGVRKARSRPHLLTLSLSRFAHSKSSQ